MTLAMAVLQRDSGNVFGALFGGMFLLFWLAVVVVVIIGGWKVFEKAGQPGWAIIVPIYNAYVLLKIAGRPGWWLILYLIPLINIVIALVVSIDIAKAFGQSAVFGVVLLFLLCGIGFLILGFGDYRYQGAPMAASLGASA
jgi:Family of unknown function (DUF5684)